MCWTLVAYMMAIALSTDLYEEWSCVELSLLQVCLEEKVSAIFHYYLQDIMIWRKKKRYKVDQASDQHTKLQDVQSGIMYLVVW